MNPPDASQPTIDLLLSVAELGMQARACGATSDDNPYLVRQALPAATIRDRVTWFIHVAAWWRGWDDEDVRQRADGRASPPFEAVRPLHLH
jgi:hypothetical protein